MNYQTMDYSQILDELESISKLASDKLDETTSTIEELGQESGEDGEIMSFLELSKDAVNLLTSFKSFWEEYEIYLKNQDISYATVNRMNTLGYSSQQLLSKLEKTVPKDKFPERLRKEFDNLYSKIADQLYELSSLSEMSYVLNRNFRFANATKEEIENEPMIERGNFLVYANNTIKFNSREIDMFPQSKAIFTLFLGKPKGWRIASSRIFDELSAQREKDINPDIISTYVSNLRRALRNNGIGEEILQIESDTSGNEGTLYRLVINQES